MAKFKLRFKDKTGGEFPQWEKKRLGDVFELTRGYVLPVKDTRPVADDEYKYPVYSSQTKNNGLMGFYNRKLYKDAITWTTDGANAGKTMYRVGEFYCTNVCGVLLNTMGYANNCVAHMIDRISKRYVSYVGNPKLMNNAMAEICLNFPCLPEQEKIAEFLSSYDEMIDITSKRLWTLQKRKLGLLQGVFSQSIRFRDSNGREFPPWTEKRLGELASYKKGPFGSALTKKIFVPKSCNSVKVYEQQNAIKKNWRLERYFIKKEYAEELKGFEVVSGDIIVSCAGTIGEQYLLPSGAEKGVLNQALMRIRVAPNVILPTIFMIYFDDMIQKYGRIYSNGSAMKNIPPLADMKKTVVQIPTMKEQQRIAEFLGAVDQGIELESQRLETMRTIKKGLIQQMFI